MLYTQLLLPSLLVYFAAADRNSIQPFWSLFRVTGAAVQVTCELRSGRRNNRAMKSDLSFSRLELLECLWEDGNPQYTEVDVTVTLFGRIIHKYRPYDFVSVQLLQFQKADMYTIGAVPRPCAQLHYSLSEKHLRRVCTLKYTHTHMILFI